VALPLLLRCMPALLVLPLLLVLQGLLLLLDHHPQ